LEKDLWERKGPRDYFFRRSFISFLRVSTAANSSSGVEAKAKGWESKERWGYSSSHRNSLIAGISKAGITRRRPLGLPLEP